ncbi:MAG: phosphoribosylformylglycinamidine synthase subunit PurL [Spirochaetota bacterium]
MTITPEIIREHNITDAEYALIKQHLGREPNINELGVFSVMWSEHCGYKNTKPLLKTLPTEGKQILQGPGENAGIVDIGGDEAIVFKIESHNHPSAVEPYQGAATGVGGILRDIFTMGARPIAMLNALRFGTLDNERTVHLTKGVVKGIGDYGNCVGIPTIAGDVYFEKTYQQNILVNAMCVGVIKKDRITKAIASGIGNLVVYYGSTTGRDGIHGATFASEELSSDGEDKRPSVQVGDPFTEKLLMEATLELIEKKLLVGVQDMGAAGLTSSSSEMASRGGVGIAMSLDNIPKRADDLTPYEMLLSESQERMLAVITPDKLEDMKAVLAKWDLNCVVIGTVVNTDRLTITYKGEQVADIPVKALTDKVPQYTRTGVVPEYIAAARQMKKHKAVPAKDALLALLDSPNIASKRWIYEQYDHMVGTDTVIRPGEAGAGVLRLKGSRKAIATCVDGNGRYTYLNPYKGGKICVAEAYRNIIAVGGKPLAVTNNLNFANPEKPEIYWQLEQSIRGMREACIILETPVTGGNCSMYNETGGSPIYPTPVIGMVGLIDDVSNARKGYFSRENEFIYLLGDTLNEMGASEYLSVVHDEIAGDTPEIDLALEKKHGETMAELIKFGLIGSASDISEGGLAVTLAEMCIAKGLGCTVTFDTGIPAEALLFGETQSRYVFTASPENIKAVEEKLRARTVRFYKLGKTTAGPNARLIINDALSVGVDALSGVYRTAIEKRLGE